MLFARAKVRDTYVYRNNDFYNEFETKIIKVFNALFNEDFFLCKTKCNNI